MEIDLNALKVLIEEAAPLPFRLEGNAETRDFDLYASGRVESLGSIEWFHNAEYIVAACNAVPALLSLLDEKDRALEASKAEGDQLFRLAVHHQERAEALIVERDALAGRVRVGKCLWMNDDDGTWHSECGNAFVFTNGGPVHNDFDYCCYCGKEVMEHAAPVDQGAQGASSDEDAAMANKMRGQLCSDCPPVDYPTDKTRCDECPRKDAQSPAPSAQKECKKFVKCVNNDGDWCANCGVNFYAHAPAENPTKCWKCQHPLFADSLTCPNGHSRPNGASHDK